MELKPHKIIFTAGATILLIVPYGIETHLYYLVMLGYYLLIVPYGIETLVEYYYK